VPQRSPDSFRDLDRLQDRTMDSETLVRHFDSCALTSRDSVRKLSVDLSR